MVTLATIVAVAACIGAVLSGNNNRRQMWYAFVGWPFASRQMTGEAAAYSAKVNKALVAFFICLMVAAAATSLATNLSRFSR